MSRERWLVYIDDTHGQANWGQTGFPSRELHTNYVGLAAVLQELGAECAPVRPRLLSEAIRHARLLVVPPPTGRYDLAGECWHRIDSSLFSPQELQLLVEFLEAGGRLLVMAYRFGDTFTGTNLQELFSRLGCPLRNDVVIDVTRLRSTHPLRCHFNTSRELLPLPWSKAGVYSVLWRAMATFSICPGVDVRPLALSPGGRCISFDPAKRRLSCQSLPIAVAGALGRGRFVLCGGPHFIETGPLGLLNQNSNRPFLRNVLTWLMEDGREPMPAVPKSDSPDLIRLMSLVAEHWRSVCEVEATGNGAGIIAFVEHLLHQSGILRALSRASWMP